MPTACPVCASPEEASRPRLREMMFGTREEFDYVLCAGCGTLRIVEVPNDLARHYPARYHYERLPVDMLPAGTLVRALAAVVSRRRLDPLGGPDSIPLRVGARLARRIAKPTAGQARWKASFRRWGVRSVGGGVLDVGCGPIPNRLIALRALGFRNLLGIDPFIEHDLKVEGVRVRKMRIEDLDGSFDVVWFHHSLEHVPDPSGALAAASRLLRPGGHVIVRTPVMGTRLWQRYGRDWWELDPPRHLFVFSAAGLTRIAAEAGLELEATIQETHFKEFVGSEQYRRDLAMFEPGSWFVDPSTSAFSPEQLAALAEDARAANAAGEAGRACFRFRSTR